MQHSAELLLDPLGELAVAVRNQDYPSFERHRVRRVRESPADERKVALDYVVYLPLLQRPYSREAHGPALRDPRTRPGRRHGPRPPPEQNHEHEGRQSQQQDNQPQRCGRQVSENRCWRLPSPGPGEAGVVLLGRVRYGLPPLQHHQQRHHDAPVEARRGRLDRYVVDTRRARRGQRGPEEPVVGRLVALGAVVDQGSGLCRRRARDRRRDRQARGEAAARDAAAVVLEERGDGHRGTRLHPVLTEAGPKPEIGLHPGPHRCARPGVYAPGAGVGPHDGDHRNVIAL